jgi:hypothetical protein
MNTIAQAHTPNLASPRRITSWRGLNRHRGLLIAIGVWLLPPSVAPLGRIGSRVTAALLALLVLKEFLLELPPLMHWSWMQNYRLCLKLTR